MDVLEPSVIKLIAFIVALTFALSFWTFIGVCVLLKRSNRH